MRLLRERIKRLCERRGETVSEMLNRAGVSRNAFYSLARREGLLPKSLKRIGAAVGLPPESFLEAGDSQGEAMRFLARRATEIAKRSPGSDPDNIRHALVLLWKEPIERLRRALVRSS